MNNKNALLRKLPKVDECLMELGERLTPDVPAALVKIAVQECIERKRQDILNGEISKAEMTTMEWLDMFELAIKSKTRSNLTRVINGTGVVIHTNLGRSLLPTSATDALVRAGSHYTNLEFDLATGKRGSRYSLVEKILCELTGAEAAMVVNNNAAAVLLVLETLASGKEAIVSRGQLVEIGGSFRIPDVMKKSGAKLVEVGATNRTHLKDYEQAITEDTALL